MTQHYAGGAEVDGMVVLWHEWNSCLSQNLLLGVLIFKLGHYP